VKPERTLVDRRRLEHLEACERLCAELYALWLGDHCRETSQEELERVFFRLIERMEGRD
jgi:hypothetical protein